MFEMVRSFKTMNRTIYIRKHLIQSNHDLRNDYCNVIDMTSDPLKVHTVMKVFCSSEGSYTCTSYTGKYLQI